MDSQTIKYLIPVAKREEAKALASAFLALNSNLEPETETECKELRYESVEDMILGAALGASCPLYNGFTCTAFEAMECFCDCCTDDCVHESKEDCNSDCLTTADCGICIHDGENELGISECKARMKNWQQLQRDMVRYGFAHDLDLDYKISSVSQLAKMYGVSWMEAHTHVEKSTHDLLYFS